MIILANFLLCLPQQQTICPASLFGGGAGRKCPMSELYSNAMAGGKKHKLLGDLLMNKKLMAVAVAGALTAPAVAFAQGSTVQIYGTLKAEYGFVKMPAGPATGPSYKNWDGLNSGSSNIGFKGEEKLGGGMSAFFQCESDLRFLGGTTRTSGSLCDRNSALGLKGGFGSVFVGTWDSPDKLAVGKTRMSEDTGWMGVTHMLFQESNRNAHSINYHSPKFGGLSVALQTTSTNRASNQTADGKKGRSNGFNVIYDQGPLTAMIGYTDEDDNAASLSINGARDKNVSVGAAYKFGKAKVGATYTQAKASAGAFEGKVSAWNLAGDFDLGGGNSVWLGYTQAGDVKGNLGGTDTGGKQWQLGFAKELSKRTEARIGYARVSNDRNADYTVGNTTASNMRLGSSSSVIALQMFHKF